VGYYFLGPRWSDLQNSKGVHLVWVTDEETMWVRTMTNSRLVTIWSFRHKGYNPGIKGFWYPILKIPMVFILYWSLNVQTRPIWKRLMFIWSPGGSFRHKGYNPGIKGFWYPILKIPMAFILYGSLNGQTRPILLMFIWSPRGSFRHKG
jgi:hypothetical protein